MYLIDTHTHIYLPEFDDDRPELMKRAREAGVAICLLPAIDSKTHGRMMEDAAAFVGCFSMMGLHPCSVNQTIDEEIKVIEDHLPNGKFVAIGETGLDFYWDKTFVKEQYRAFRRQAELAKEMDLPIVIHSRNATDECVEVIREFPGIRGVFHCFSGNYEQASAIIEAGLYLGIGGVVTFKNSGLDKVVERTGLDRVVLETDAPYLAPVPYRGKRNEPAYVPLVAERLAVLTGKTVEEVAKITTENAVNLFKL
jgi:TatD DNase family protein